MTPFLPSAMEVPRISALLNEREQQRRILASTPDANPTHSFSVAIGSSEENQSKNRYRDIIAYDRTLLKGAYVNASLIREPEMGISGMTRRHWIAAQAPIPSTIYDFYSILFHSPCSVADPTPLERVNVIVQLTALVEGGRRKAHRYFSDIVGETVEYEKEGGGESVSVVLTSQEVRDGSIRRELEVTIGGELRNIAHHEYLGWGDHGVPTDSAHLVNFIKAVQTDNYTVSNTASPTSPLAPILVHCSAGVGRTGTYIAISSLLNLVDLYSRATITLLPLSSPPTGLPLYPADQFSVAREFVGLTIDGIRDQRTTMVQTDTQIAFIFDTLRMLSP